MSPKRFTQSAALGLAVAALAAPAAADAQDLRSPDARTAAPAVDPKLDLRTPDSRDLGLGRGTADAPDIMVVKLREPAPAPAPAADGLDWGDAGIGAAVLLGIGALALGAAFAAAHRRRPATTA
jgi:hypothetical protein